MGYLDFEEEDRASVVTPIRRRAFFFSGVAKVARWWFEIFFIFIPTMAGEMIQFH